MSDMKERLQRARSQFPPSEGVMESLQLRRDRRHRNQRIRAGVLGLAIAIAVGWLGVNTIRSTPPVPADDPTPTEGLGIFAPVAGRIVYGNTEGNRSYLWAVDPSVAGDGASTRVRLPQDALPPDLWTTPLGWSSDGTELLFKRGYGEECCFPEEYLYILHADGSETQLNSEPIFFAEYSATISPDGTRVVFAAQGDLSGLYVIDAEGGRPVRSRSRTLGEGRELADLLSRRDEDRVLRRRERREPRVGRERGRHRRAPDPGGRANRVRGGQPACNGRRLVTAS